jgi:aspartate/glutamate racemase
MLSPLLQAVTRVNAEQASKRTMRRPTRIIMDELVYGVFKPDAVAFHQEVIGRMKDQGCDAVVLGCTEIPLIMNDENSPLPTLDSTRLLARAALRRAVQRATPQAYRRHAPYTESLLSAAG